MHQTISINSLKVFFLLLSSIKRIIFHRQTGSVQKWWKLLIVGSKWSVLLCIPSWLNNVRSLCNCENNRLQLIIIKQFLRKTEQWMKVFLCGKDSKENFKQQTSLDNAKLYLSEDRFFTQSLLKASSPDHIWPYSIYLFRLIRNHSQRTAQTVFDSRVKCWMAVWSLERPENLQKTVKNAKGRFESIGRRNVCKNKLSILFCRHKRYLSADWQTLTSLTPHPKCSRVFLCFNADLSLRLAGIVIAPIDNGNEINKFH